MEGSISEPEKAPIKAKKNYLKIILKTLLYFILSILVLNLVLYILLSIPFIQQKVVDFALEKLKPIVNTELSIDRVQIRLFNHINLQGVYIESQTKDTLLYAGNLDVSISPWQLFANKLQINEVELDGFVINVSQATPQSDFNFQFLIDAFSSDTTTKAPSENPLVIAIDYINLKQGRLTYNVLSEASTPELFNPYHISVDSLNATINLHSIVVSDLDLVIKNLSLKEKSGLHIKNLETSIKSKGSNIWADKLNLALPHSFLSIKKAEFNTETEQFSLETETSTISPVDMQVFTKELASLTDIFSLKGILSGQLPFVKLDELELSYGDKMSIKANASISDYTNYSKADLLLQIENASISQNAITDFARIGDPKFAAPDILKTLGNIRLNGELKGKLDKLQIKLEAWVKQGAIRMVAKGSTDSTFQSFKVDAQLHTQNFNLAPLTNNSGLERLTMNANITARQTSKQALSAEVKGKLDAIGYNKQILRNILFSAHYDTSKMGAWIKANLPVGKLDANVAVKNQRIPEYLFDLALTNLQLDRFYENPNWNRPLLSFRLDGSLTGSTLNNVAGIINLDSLNFSADEFSFKPGRITLESNIQGDKRFIDFASSLGKLNITGDYNLVELPIEFSKMMHNYLPSFFDDYESKNRSNNDFTITASIENTDSLSKIFDLPFTVINPIKINGNINTIDNLLKLNADMPHFKVGDLDIKNTVISVSNNDSALDVTSSLRLLEELGFVKVDLNIGARADTINTIITVKTDSADVTINGKLKALAYFNKIDKKELISYLKILPTDVTVGRLNLGILPATITNCADKTEIKNLGIALDDEPYFGIDGIISNNKDDSLMVYFNQAQIGNLLKAFDINNISAIADGKIKLKNVLQQPQLYTQGLKLRDIILFNDTLGTLDIASRWNSEKEAIQFEASLLNAKSKNIAKGLVYTATDSMNVNVKLDHLPLSWVQPFIPEILNKLTGSISTNLTLKGKMAAPNAEGWVAANSVSFGVEYTNVTYNISDTIRITSDKVGFDNLVLTDNSNNTAIINALVTHRDFDKFEYTMNMKLNNLLLLNTENRTDSLFYGKVFASGDVKIKGNQDDINIDMKITNNRHSNINVLIPQTSEASEYKSIVYINTPQEAEGAEAIVPIIKQVPLPLKLNVDLNLTPDITLGVVLDPITGDAMQIKGAGLINFNYDMQSDRMKTFGDYILSDGTVRLKLQRISTIEFKIREGGKLHFAGDPLKTSFDIVAFRRVRADIGALDESFRTEGTSSSKVFVDCTLHIKGNMDKMELSYDIELPDASDDLKRKVRSLISTDEQKIMQFAYLIATGSFYTESSNPANLGGGMLNSAASTAISSGIDAILGGVLGDKWKVGADISNQNMSVNVSTNFFDDKLVLNTNLGYRSDNQSIDNENTFIGDFDVEYRLSKNFKLKVYNHTDDRWYRQASTIQGLGIVYTKEAKTLKSLFRSFRKKGTTK